MIENGIVISNQWQYSRVLNTRAVACVASVLDKRAVACIVSVLNTREVALINFSSFFPPSDLITTSPLYSLLNLLSPSVKGIDKHVT